MTFTHAVTAQGEVTSSGGNWSARVNGSTVYTGNNYVEAINTACNRAGNNATINIRNSGSSGPGIGNIYGARPLAGQTLDFHGTTFNANGDPFIVPVYADRRNGITVRNLRVTGSPRYGIWFRGCSNTTFTNITMDVNSGLGIRVDASTGPASDLTINGDILIEGTSTHAIETYTVGGVDIGDVTCNYTGGCGVLLNDSWDCRVGVVTGNYNN
ncbi:MAG: hypothetical protein WA952_13890, partial [Lewinella sp.]